MQENDRPETASVDPFVMRRVGYRVSRWYRPETASVDPFVMRRVGYRVSRWWNRIAYAVIGLGRLMIWDFTGRNADILSDRDFGSETTRAILCDKKVV